MQAFFQLLSVITWYVAGLVFVAGSLNALFDLNLGLKAAGASTDALPSDFSTIVILTIFTLLLGAVFYVLGNFRQVLRVMRRYRWPLLGGLALITALTVGGVSLAMPNLMLEMAVQGGDSAKAQSLLQKRDYSEETLNYVLYWAVESEDYVVSEMMLEQGADINHRRGEGDNTLLNYAVMYFPASSTDFLLTQGIDVNVVDEFGTNALHDLLNYRENNVTTDEAEILALAQQLVDAEIDTELTNTFGDTPLSIAQDQGYETVAAYLEQL
ncbi:MAG: hypothetical protein AAGH67_09375 [Cyanobacteria bacterium P01_H01_bin.162]